MVTPVRRIGVFDSGVGGLTVLRALLRALPGAFDYVSDAAHAPYGERDETQLQQRAQHVADFLRAQRCDALVVACNSATAAAVQALREAHPSWPIVGVEPGVKPAVALTRSGHVGVLATGATLRSERFARLVARESHGVKVHSVACVGLADAIERDAPSAELLALIERYAAPLRDAGCDVVVLGCTHYPLVAPLIQSVLGPGVTLIDTADAIARRVAALMPPLEPPSTAQAAAQVRLWTTGNPDGLTRFAERALGIGVVAQGLPG